MLSQQINDIGIVFSVSINGRDLYFREWSATDDCIYYFPLATLVDNGNAFFHKHECTVPFDSIYLLDETDRKILGFPPLYDKAMRLRGEGMLNSSDFSYKLELLTHIPNGDIIPFEICANIVLCGEKQHLLLESQYKLFNAINQFNAAKESQKTTDYNLRCFSEIKQIALNAGCELDSYLANENVYVPDKIRLEVGKDKEYYTIMPYVDIEDRDKFTSAFDRMRKVQGVYPVQNEKGERTRIVFTSEQKESLQPLKEHRCRYKSRDEIKSVIENPTEYFNPDQFDLSDFYSDRVIEIGVYKPRFYPFICPYKSCWIAGATIECPQNGTTKLTVENIESLIELEHLIDEADKNNERTINYKDTSIDVKDASYLANIARKQFASPDKPIKSPKDSEGYEVLIIEENAEELGFKVKERIIETGGKYTLFKDPYLNKNFQLKVHQKEGVAWLQHLYKNKASGCLMADDMGLGKTLQVLYFIDWHSRNYPDHNPYLIVAPISLLENWENEYNRFFNTPRLSINRLTSKYVERKFDKSIIDKMQKMDIILTNYESLRISQLNFCAVTFDIVILDEAQKIKSPGTLVTNAAKALKCNFKIAMTGTPVENSLLDLWCIMDFCVPGLLGNAKVFASHYQSPLKNDETDIVVLGNEIHDKLGMFFMRRLKQDVAKDLPRKLEFKETVEMPPLQEDKYRFAVNEYINGNQCNMFLTIMSIREISEHPYLHDSTISSHSTQELIETSARLKITIHFLDKIKERNEKVIIFAERKETQKMLQKIAWEHYGIIAKIINGDTPSIATKYSNPNKQSRQVSIDEFQATDGFNIILMSPIAAGMGLNVTGANHVIHYSRHWNPAKENQATDRAYRIGQTKDVYVYYPMAISKNFRSFDIILDELLNRKTSLATSTIFPTERIEVTREELGQMLFRDNPKT